jgi:hypothetical protein
VTSYSSRPFTDCEGSPQGEPETRRLPPAAQLPLPYIKAPTTVPNAISIEPEGWISAPLLRRPSNPLPLRTKLLIAVGVAALPACYFMFENCDGRSAIEASPSRTLPGRGSRSFATSGHDSNCFPSASAVRVEHPGGWPSWTLRAPGHECVRCWYVPTRTAGPRPP